MPHFQISEMCQELRLLHSLVFKKRQFASNLGLSRPLEVLNSGVCEQSAILPCKDSALEAIMCVSNHWNDLQNAKG